MTKVQWERVNVSRYRLRGTGWEIVAVAGEKRWRARHTDGRAQNFAKVIEAKRWVSSVIKGQAAKRRRLGMEKRVSTFERFEADEPLSPSTVDLTPLLKKKTKMIG
jgi:hypothetical protein